MHVLHCVFVGEENDGSRKSRLPAKRVCATCPWGFMGDISGSPRLSRSPRLSGSPRLVGGARKRAPLIRVVAKNEKSPNRKTVSCPFPLELHGIGQALCAVFSRSADPGVLLPVATSVSGLPLRVCCCRTHECRCIFVIEKSRSPCCAWGSKK